MGGGAEVGTGQAWFQSQLHHVLAVTSGPFPDLLGPIRELGASQCSSRRAALRVTEKKQQAQGRAHQGALAAREPLASVRTQAPSDSQLSVPQPGPGHFGAPSTKSTGRGINGRRRCSPGPGEGQPWKLPDPQSSVLPSTAPTRNGAHCLVSITLFKGPITSSFL